MEPRCLFGRQGSVGGVLRAVLIGLATCLVALVLVSSWYLLKARRRQPTEDSDRSHLIFPDNTLETRQLPSASGAEDSSTAAA
jgi:uncharacterized iron-regulated membrane protein